MVSALGMFLRCRQSVELERYVWLVDTSTGVLSNAKMIGETVKEVSPDTLVRQETAE